MTAEHHESRRQARPLRKHRWLTPLIILIVVVGLVAIVWLWALPYYVEKRLVESFSSMTGREVTIASVDVNPVTARLTLVDLRIAGEERTPVLSSDRIEAAIEWRSLWSPGWRLESLDFQSPHLQLIWLEDAQWNLAQLFGSDSDEESQEPTPIRIRQINASEGRLDWINRRPDEPITLSLERVRLEAQDYDNSSDEPFTLQGQGDWNGGTLSGEGEMGFSPWTVDVDLSAEQLPLTTLSEYLAHVMRARANTGALAAQVRLQAGEASDAGTRLTGKGNLRELEMLAPNADRPIATAERLSVEGLVFESDQPRLLAEQVVLHTPWLDVTIDEQFDTNLAAWRPPEQQGGTSRGGSSLSYALESLVVEQGAVAFADRHLPQPFSLDFTALQGEWRDLASSRESNGQLQLEGEVADGSPMRIEGAFDPLGDAMQGNLNLHFENLSLSTFAPYLRHFGGYEIEQGQVMLDLDYRLENGQLQADNRLVLRRVELGEQVDDSATDLPVKALIGVLQDDDGVIDLAIPLEMPLDDPSSIDFGSIAGQAIREALENLVSSPLETLSELGTNGDENGDGDRSGDASDESAGIYESTETQR